MVARSDRTLTSKFTSLHPAPHTLPPPTMPSLPLKYAYFPGCVAQGACRELYQSTQALTQALGIELVELKKASCCGSGTFKEDSQFLEDTVN
ncbi:MAG TPA: heterodisulfide reductase-related iron-sulfur binding cluster, partial [Crinalium sp.]